MNVFGVYQNLKDLFHLNQIKCAVIIFAMGTILLLYAKMQSV